MQTILDRIHQKKCSYAESPIFSFLKNASISPRERFAFAPCVAPFIMGFSDVNKLMLRDDASCDPLQQLVNTHTNEDEHHWRMFLKDLNTLGFDVTISLGQSLEMLWGEDCQNARQVIYGLAAIIDGLNPRLRMVVVEAIEAAGNVAFSRLRELADEFKKSTGKELYFFGRVHEALETGHAVGNLDIEEKLRRVALTPEEEAQALNLVDRVFRLFSNMGNEALAYTLRLSRHEEADGRSSRRRFSV